tara:strand:- start:1469 stop:1699 length:231 start_codon:yes stop_codon:yes gene_type:complete
LRRAQQQWAPEGGGEEEEEEAAAEEDENETRVEAGHKEKELSREVPRCRCGDRAAKLSARAASAEAAARGRRGGAE